MRSKKQTHIDMTNNKKSALEQLKSLYPAQLLNDDGSVKCELGPSVMVNAILELAEKVELIIETQTAAKNNQLTFAQVTEMLEPIVKKLEALEAKQSPQPLSFKFRQDKSGMHYETNDTRQGSTNAIELPDEPRTLRSVLDSLFPGMQVSIKHTSAEEIDISVRSRAKRGETK